MRDYATVSPVFWTDQYGRQWKVPTILGRLKMRIPCHRALRDFVINRDKCCKMCGATENLVADHILSRRNGGSHHPDNMQALCASCNAIKASTVDRKQGKD